jgi:hypothetical protein
MAKAPGNRGRAARGTPPPPEQLTASILSWSRSYAVSQQRPGGNRVGDEALLEIPGEILDAAPRHRQHVGETVEITLACARSFDEDTGAATGKPFLLYMNADNTTSRVDCPTPFSSLPSPAVNLPPSKR